MIAAALLGLLSQLESLPGAVQAVRVELSGPLDSVEFSTARGPTRIEHPLQPGELVELVVPLVAEDARSAAAARVRIEGPRDDGGVALGRARLVSVLPAHPALEELPPALRARALPVPQAGGALGPAAWLAALCAGVLALALRNRALVAAAAAVAGAVAVAALRRPIEPQAVEVLEASVGDVWLARSVGAGVVTLPPVGQPWRAFGVPSEVQLEVRVSADGRAVLRGRGSLVVEAPWVAPLERPSAAGNQFEDFVLVYTRFDGVWQRRGPWPMGEPLPAVAALEPQAPPGWLAAGLPLHGQVWLAQRSSGGWLRLVQ